MRPLVNIVCLCYNHESFIRQALDGFVMQKTTFPFKIVVHDDASTDNSVNIIKEYENRFPQLFHCIYRKENWYSQKKDILLDVFENYCNGKYIALCEGDDYWTDPYKLQKQVDFLEAHPDYVMCSHCFDQYIQNGKLLIKEKKKENEGTEYDLINLLIGKWLTQTLTVMFRRKALDLDLLRSYKNSQDVVLFYALLKKGKGYCLSDIMGVYRVHEGGVWSGISLDKQRLLEFRQRLTIYKVEKSEEAAIFLLGLFERSMRRIWILKQWALFIKAIEILNLHYGFIFTFKLMFDRLILNKGLEWEILLKISRIKIERLRLKKDLRDGLSGLMRIKNEASFIEGCIDSCIDALDELIIVYNDCTDDTPKIVEKKRKQYPHKIKVYAYNYSVLSHNLTKEEFEYAKNLPENSPRLHSNQCNFALAEANYKYGVKIDADQLYFTDELKKWRDVCNGTILIKWNISFVLGWLFMMYFTAYRRLSVRCGKPCLWMIPNWLVIPLFKYYHKYSQWQLQRGKACIALSGLNVFKDDCWYVPFDGVNIHPPYNGAGDTVIFKISNSTYWKRHCSDKIPYSVTENFYNPYKMMFTYPVWFHLHANREYCWSKVKNMKDEHPECFVLIEDFLLMTYQAVLNKMDKKAHTLFQMTLFALIHKIGKDVIKKHIGMLVFK